MRHFPTAFLVLVLAGGCTSEWDPARRQVAAAIPTGPAIVRDMAMPRPGPRSPAGLAVSPDRGVLLDYDTSRNVAQSGGYTSYPVDLSEAHAFRAISTGEMKVSAPDGSTIRLRYERHVEHPDGNWSWIGRDAEGTDAVVTFGEKAVFGSIPFKGHPALRITHASGRSWLVATNPRMVADGAMPKSGKQDYLVPPDVVQAVGEQKQSTATAPAMAQIGSPVVDVVLGYTNGFAASFGGQSQAVTRLTNMVDITNQAYANSQIVAQVRLTGTVLVNYPDATNNQTALEELTGYRSGSIPVPSALLPLRAAREQFGGDLVSLVRKFRTPENQGCGIAWLLGGGGSQIDQSDAPFAYSIVSDGSDLDESDSKTYFCREETLAHEFGHNMGQAHNPEDSTSIGAHPYAYGYREASSSGFYTVMAYRLKDSSQFAIRYFSNPNVAYQGRPTGTSSADNARSLVQTMPIIASFLGGTVPGVVAKPRNDINGDGKSDILWRNTSEERTSRWYMNGPGLIGGNSDYQSANYRIVGTGDFDADGRSDLLWANTTNTHLIMWRSRANGQYEGSYVGSYPVGWAVAGVFDMNGDGKSDIVWRNASQESTVRWFMDGNIVAGTRSDYQSMNYRIVGIGDFDGDLRGDLLWTNTANDHLIMWRSRVDGQYEGSYAGGYPPGWAVAGIVDLNADGKSDIVWRNVQEQRISRWYMSGSNVLGGNSDYQSSNYRIVATGDFNGDGRGDLLWTNAANDHLLMWRMQADEQFIGSYVGSYPAGWTVENGNH